jgi:hypothetical protein
MKRELIIDRKIIEETIQACDICFVGMVDKDNQAYRNKEVACSYSVKSFSVVTFCNVSFPEEMEEKREALDIIMNHYSKENFHYSDPAVRNVKVWKAEIKEVSCKETGASHK